LGQETFATYTERTAFERPLTSGVAYAVRVLHSEREQFERQQGWTIKSMNTVEQTPVHEDDYAVENLKPSAVQEEYAPVIFAQETISHVVSVDVLSGKVCMITYHSLLLTCQMSLEFCVWQDQDYYTYIA